MSRRLVHAVPMVASPGGTLRPEAGVQDAEVFEVDEVAGVVRRFQASRTPSIAGSPGGTPPTTSRRRHRRQDSPSTSGEPGPSRKSRRSLPLSEMDLGNVINAPDSSSEIEDDSDSEVTREEVLQLMEELGVLEPPAERDESRHVEEVAMDVEEVAVDVEEVVVDIPNQQQNVEGGNRWRPEDVNVFSWSEDYESFAGQEEPFTRTPGPTVNETDPTNIFLLIWDITIVTYIVQETNRYARRFLEAAAEVGAMSENLMSWEEITVAEFYRYLGVIILMTHCNRTKLADYWTIGTLEMPKFRAKMSRNRFNEISRFLHFVDNDEVPTNLSSHERKMFKVQCIIDHCNAKFQDLYIPDRALSLDESLLLWKGRLAWIQCIRSKAARFGMKSYDLCEARTAYLLNVSFYTGKASDSVTDAVEGFTNVTAKVVLKLSANYLDKGHCLYMDNWYNQMALTRYLKFERHTDVVGTLSRKRQNVPEAIRGLDDKRMARGDVVSRHCGDISVIAWKDVKLVTTLSTFHKPEMAPGTRAGEEVDKPLLIHDYNKNMGGVDLKDQMLSMFLMERKRGLKWYVKVFKRMLNSSLLNTFIIYKSTPNNPKLSHRDMRQNIADDLFARYPVTRPRAVVVRSYPIPDPRLNSNLRHIPDLTDANEEGIRPRRRCKRCWVRSRLRRQVTTFCRVCDVGLCLGSCWEKYHYDAEL